MAHPSEGGVAKPRDHQGQPGYRMEGTHVRRQRLGAALAATVLSTMIFAGPAAAAEPTDATITGGDLSIPTAPTAENFGTVTLNGSAQTTSAAMQGFTVTDARGTGDGWKVTVAATQFKEYDTGGAAYVVSGSSLGLNSLSLPAPTVAANGTTSPPPSIVAGPYSIDASSDGATAVQIASAAVNEGMGRYDFTQSGSLTLSIPASTYAGTYRSELTVSAVSGP